MFRHLAEQALEQMPGIMFVIDGRWELLRWNHNLEYLTGYSVEKLQGLPALDIIAPEDRILVASAMRLIFQEGRAAVEARILTSDGWHAPHYFTGSVAQIESKPCIIGLGLDISERLALEERLRTLSLSDDLTGLLNRRGFFNEGRRHVLAPCAAVFGNPIWWPGWVGTSSPPWLSTPKAIGI